MTFCTKISVADCSVQSSANTNKISAPDSQDVQAFSTMMEQGNGTVEEGAMNSRSSQQDCGAPLDAEDMPSMAGLMAQMANSMQGRSGLKGMDYEESNLIQDMAPNAYTASLLAGMNSALQNSVLQNPMSNVVVETTSVSAPHFTVKEIDAMVNMLVERITVTDTSAHMVTVEVALSDRGADTALRGTTLSLTRSMDGLLVVNVMTNDAATFQTLVGAQVDLKAKLEALDTGLVRVEISHENQEQERDPNRRSATYQAYSESDDDQGLV